MAVFKRIAIVLTLALVAAATRAIRLSAFDDHQRHQHYQDVYYLPPAEWLPTVSLGYTSALADLLWCRALVYFGEEIGQRGAVKYLFSYMDAVIGLDPDFKAAYRWAATGIMYRPVGTTLEEATHGADYLRRAVLRWPNDGDLRWSLGSFLRFELAPMIQGDPSAKDRVLAEAAPHLHIAGLKGAGPPWLVLNNATLLTKLGQKEHAIEQLQEIYPTVNDESTRLAIRERLAQLRSESYAAAVQVADEQFEQERQTNFPYLTPDMFLLVGPKAAPRHPSQVASHFSPAEYRDDTSEPVAAPVH